VRPTTEFRGEVMGGDGSEPLDGHPAEGGCDWADADGGLGKMRMESLSSRL
jgi:hypothetical protein